MDRVRLSSAGNRIEVAFTRPELDSRGSALADRIREDLGQNVAEVRVLDIYYLALELDERSLAAVAAGLLTDPVLQSFSYRADLVDDADWVIEVGFLPGVTDNAGRTAGEAVGAMLEVPTESDTVRTAVAYAIKGEVTKEAAERICLGTLANPLIHAYQIKSGTEYEDTVFSPPPVRTAHLPTVGTVRLPADDAGLAKISRDGLLALDITEMRSIKNYFDRSDVRSARAEAGLDPDPTDIELETLAQTWSEHCKHKIFNSRISYSEAGGDPEVIDSLFKTYIQRATETIGNEIDWLVSVFTDNAGIIKLNDDYNLVFKVETHNHPSALDPYGGALTGIVGVNRDPMGTGLGAELIFNTDVFCFGPPDTPPESLPAGILHPRRIFRGVRQGVEDGGNQIGIPTVSGAILFDEAYIYNPLVFCGTGGIMPKEIAGAPSHLNSIEPGDLIVMVGGRIGKDGIHGATFSSIKLEETTPAAVVQIGAPIVQKKMMDALIEARDRGLYRAITDNGAGGLSSSVGEMCEMSGGAEVELELAPLKYSGLDPWQIWVSESQERMTLAVPPEKIDELLDLLGRRDVEATAIGRFTSDGYLKVKFDSRLIAMIDIEWLHSGLPRLQLEARWEEHVSPAPAPTAIEPADALARILGSLNVCSKESVIRQYDHEVQGSSIVKPLVGVANDGPSDAALLRPRADCKEGVAVGCGINPKYGLVDPYSMAVSAVDEAVRNVVAVGADPRRIAILDNFCWGNPIKTPDNPDGDIKLGQLVRAARGCYDAAVALRAPYISGKDSFHNEYDLGAKTVSIPPTLLVSAIGVVPDVDKAVTMDAKRAGDLVYALGLTRAELGGSHLSELTGISGAPPAFDGKSAADLYGRVHDAMAGGLIASCHDCSEGGLAVALAETAFSGGLGMRVNMRKVRAEGADSDVERLFSESNSRFVVTVKPDDAAEFERLMAGSVWENIGRVTRERRLQVIGVDDRPVIDSDIDQLKKVWQETLSWV